ncbi:hypothetical protein JVU11DRAFT_2773 [Chiua virens]|nr:hypothetical protein JVU11DRAFT_2773 [Chiua virens]
MQDSDDYFTNDDLIIDDKTLSILDEEESKYKRLTNAQTQQNVGPPAKRQKTGPWQRPPVSRPIQRTDTSDDMDNLPDVSVRQDGTYGLQDKQTRASAPSSRSESAPGISARPSVTAPRSRGSGPVMRSVSGTGPPQRATPVVSRPPLVTRNVLLSVSSQDASQTLSTGLTQLVAGNRNGSPVAASSVSTEQLMEEIRKKDEVIREKADAYEAVKFAKDGEATILRKRMEKTAQEHLAQLAKLKAAKEEVDAKHLSLQKQYEADKERWKTEMTFRRHEETSRRHPGSHFPKNDSPQRTQPMPSQRQRPSQWNSAGPSRPAPETPRRPRFGVISDLEKPKKSPTLETRHLPSGFQTGPPRSQPMMGWKGKEPASFNAPVSPVIPSASPVAPGSSGRFPQPDVFGTQMDIGGPLEDVIPQVDVGVNDVQMMDEGTPVMTLSTQENAVPLTLPSPNLMLHDIMQTHRLQGSELPTLQSLLCSSPTDSSQVQSYGAALMRILDTLGGIPADPERDFDHLAQIICCALCEITELLARNNLVCFLCFFGTSGFAQSLQIPPLVAVLNLLTELAYMVPSICAFLLSQSVGDHEETPRLLGVLHNIMQDQLRELDVTTGNEPPELRLLAQETLSLYEALVCWISDDLEDIWNAYPSLPSLFTTLIQPNRPQWFLVKGVRELVWLSTRPNLFRSLLSYPVSEQTGNNAELHNPQIALACSLLTDTSRRGPEADELKGRIIMFFGRLSNVHPDAHTQLVESEELIPSVVVFLYHLVTPIWDEDGVIFDDPQVATRSVQLINHAMLLLYILVVGEDTTVDLRERLLRAPAKTYQGLMQFFIMTFGRLSYANPPYWLEGKDRQRLVDVTDIAKVLLERVVQGPELDLIWESYHDEGEENEAVMDVEDEVEA